MQYKMSHTITTTQKQNTDTNNNNNISYNYKQRREELNQMVKRQIEKQQQNLTQKNKSMAV